MITKIVAVPFEQFYSHNLIGMNNRTFFTVNNLTAITLLLDNIFSYCLPRLTKMCVIPHFIPGLQAANYQYFLYLVKPKSASVALIAGSKKTSFEVSFMCRSSYINKQLSYTRSYQLTTLIFCTSV